MQPGGAEGEVACQPDRVEVVADLEGPVRLLHDVDGVGGQVGEQIARQQEEGGWAAPVPQHETDGHPQQRQIHRRIGHRGDADEQIMVRTHLRRDQVEPGQQNRREQEHRSVEQAGDVPFLGPSPGQQNETDDEQRIVAQI